MQPNAGEIRAELNRVLASAGFEQAGRARDFLRFVVEETLADRGDRLKGYSIAIEVFGKPADFDAQTDPLVRVEAGRLRRRLLEYYSSEGVHNPIRISLPRGSYAAEFHRPTIQEPQRQPRGKTRPRLQWPSVAIGGFAVVALVWLAIVFLPGTSPPTTDGPIVVTPENVTARSSGPSILVTPFANLSEDDFAYFAYGITEELIVHLSAIPFFVITNSGGYAIDDEQSESLLARTEADYVLTGSVRNTKERIRIVARLVDPHSGRQLWSRVFDENLDLATLLTIQENIARSVAVTVGEPLGPLYEQEIARTAARSASDLDAYDCLLRFYYFAQTLKREVHAESVECFLRTLQNTPGFAIGWSALAILYRIEYVYGYNPRAGEPDALIRAREAARTALDIDGSSFLGNVAIALIRQTSGDTNGFLAGVDRAFTLNTVPTSIVQLGMALVFAGDSERGMPMIEQALKLSPRPAGWFYMGPTAHYLHIGDYENALSSANRIDLPDFFGGPMFVAASAALAGRPDIATRAAAQLIERYPEFPRNGRELLTRWSFEETIYSRMIEGLELAGVPLE
jgi:TolB-like protein